MSKAVVERVRVTVRVPLPTAKKLRTLIRDNRGAPLYLTLDGFASDVLEQAVSKLEKISKKGRQQ